MTSTRAERTDLRFKQPKSQTSQYTATWFCYTLYINAVHIFENKTPNFCIRQNLTIFAGNRNYHLLH